MGSEKRILLSVRGSDASQWRELLSAHRDVTLEPDGADDPSIEYAVVWSHQPDILARLPNLKAIFSLGAGVDHILTDPKVPDVPILRVVADNLTQHMVEYAVWRVLDHHRQGLLYRTQQQSRMWREAAQPAANEITVGIMGLGQLGTAVAKALLVLGYKVNGWSRTARDVDGVACFHGTEGLTPFLNNTDILVVLLPLTPATRGILDYELLGKLNRWNALGGACLVNAGRGQLQKDADILRALDQGLLKEASLDVFETEPLPEASPLWNHANVFITPHAAASSDPEHLVPLMLEQMRIVDRGEMPTNVVDRNAGY